MTGKPHKNYITPTGFKALSDELNHLLKVERPAVVQEVADAAAQGDRSENAEYIYGKKRLREIDRRVQWLTKRLKNSVVVNPEQQSGDTVYFGATVVVEEQGDEKTFKLVGVDEIDLAKGWISWRSPLGRALIGKALDDQVSVKTPNGVRVLDIVEVEYL